MTRAALHALVLACAFAAVVPALAAAQPSADPDPDSHVAARAERTWSLRLTGELGFGTSDIDLPVDGVVQRIRPGLFPAVGLGFELDHRASEAVALGLLVRYQSSLAHGIVERHTDGSEHALDVRSHRLELAFAPTFLLDDGGVWSVRAAAGCAFRSFRPEVHHLVTPAYSLVGPHLRVALGLALWGGAVRLSVGPELQWIAHAGSALREREMAAQGWGAGGEAALEISLAAHWSLRAAYHELRAWLDSAQPQTMQDTTRFVTAGVVGAL